MVHGFRLTGFRLTILRSHSRTASGELAYASEGPMTRELIDAGSLEVVVRHGIGRSTRLTPLGWRQVREAEATKEAAE